MLRMLTNSFADHSAAKSANGRQDVSNGSFGVTQNDVNIFCCACNFVKVRLAGNTIGTWSLSNVKEDSKQKLSSLNELISTPIAIG